MNDHYFDENIIAKSSIPRPCTGCQNEYSIREGDPFWMCTLDEEFTYFLCVPCRTHLDECNECYAAWTEEGGTCWGVNECRTRVGLTLEPGGLAT